MYAHVEERLRQGIFLVVKSNDDAVLSQGLGGGGGSWVGGKMDKEARGLG